MTILPAKAKLTKGDVLPPVTPQTLEAHRAELLQTATDFQAGTIDLAEVKRITAASRDFLRRTTPGSRPGTQSTSPRCATWAMP